MQNERGTQHGTSRRTPLPLFRAVSIFCLSVAIFSTSLRVGFGHSLPPCARVIRRDGGRRQAPPPATDRERPLRCLGHPPPTPRSSAPRIPPTGAPLPPHNSHP